MGGRKNSKANPEDAIADKIWSAYLNSCESLFLERKTPHKIFVEIESLIETAERNLTERVNTYNTSGRNLRDSWLSCFYQLKADCHAKLGHVNEACGAFDRSIKLESHNAHHHENYIYFLISIDRFEDAAKKINAIPIAAIESEEDSTAINILRWACAHVEVSKSIDPNLLKHCVTLLGKYGSTVVLKNYSTKPNSKKVNGSETKRESR